MNGSLRCSRRGTAVQTQEVSGRRLEAAPSANLQISHTFYPMNLCEACTLDAWSTLHFKHPPVHSEWNGERRITCVPWGLHVCPTTMWEAMSLNALELISWLDQKAEQCVYTAALGTFSRTFAKWPSELCYCPTWKNAVRKGPPSCTKGVTNARCKRDTIE